MHAAHNGELILFGLTSAIFDREVNGVYFTAWVGIRIQFQLEFLSMVGE
jgi:hypothetical protein